MLCRTMERLLPASRAGSSNRETAATLRRLMEGVVLNGTGKLARLNGWTAAGKTGSAQKIDTDTGRYSPTQLIASFTGFAPINNPAITILVSLDSPVGLHEGGMVAAPVFKRIAEQVLPYLDVPRDVPAGQADAGLLQKASSGQRRDARRFHSLRFHALAGATRIQRCHYRGKLFTTGTFNSSSSLLCR